MKQNLLFVERLPASCIVVAEQDLRRCQTLLFAAFSGTFTQAKGTIGVEKDGFAVWQTIY